MIDSTFICDHCHCEEETLYEGYFYTSAKNNEFAKGTPSAGLLRLQRVCECCLREAIETGMTKAKEVPS